MVVQRFAACGIGMSICLGQGCSSKQKNLEDCEKKPTCCAYAACMLIHGKQVAKKEISNKMSRKTVKDAAEAMVRKHAHTDRHTHTWKPLPAIRPAGRPDAWPPGRPAARPPAHPPACPHTGAPTCPHACKCVALGGWAGGWTNGRTRPCTHARPPACLHAGGLHPLGGGRGPGCQGVEQVIFFFTKYEPVIPHGCDFFCHLCRPLPSATLAIPPGHCGV